MSPPIIVPDLYGLIPSSCRSPVQLENHRQALIRLDNFMQTVSPSFQHESFSLTVWINFKIATLSLLSQCCTIQMRWLRHPGHRVTLEELELIRQCSDLVESVKNRMLAVNR